MLMDSVSACLPRYWAPMSLSSSKDYYLVDIPRSSSKYTQLESEVEGVFNRGVLNIVRVQNPFLYGQYLLKKEEYATHRNERTRVIRLYHDTAQSKIPSIVGSNLNWRRTVRSRFGKGVSFSPSPKYANQQSSRLNGTNRAIIVAEVLIRNSEKVGVSYLKKLPSDGYDTSVGNSSNVYVKYYDNEFYPKYVIYYKSN